MNRTLPVKLLTEHARLPRRAHEGDAGLDLHADEDVTIPPGERRVVRIGIAIAIEEGFAGLIVPRSGLAVRHGLALVNAPGLIDAQYRGELKVILVNTDAHEEFSCHRGDRIAQLVIVPFAAVTPAVVDDLDATGRGLQGLGSTGR